LTFLLLLTLLFLPLFEFFVLLSFFSARDSSRRAKPISGWRMVLRYQEDR
jgi:hypothetical protein